MVLGRGIEPLLHAWKACVLTDRRTEHTLLVLPTALFTILNSFTADYCLLGRLHNASRRLLSLQKAELITYLDWHTAEVNKVPLAQGCVPQTLYEKALGCLIEITVLNLPYRAVHGLVYQPHYVPTCSSVLLILSQGFLIISAPISVKTAYA